MSKYKNKKVSRQINGETVLFDSNAEALRYDFLLTKLKAGSISELILQPEFCIMDGFRRNGKAIRAIKYVSDFKYTKDGETIVEDLKGFYTDIYKLKKKLFLSKHGDGLRFIEVRKNKNVWMEKEI